MNSRGIIIGDYYRHREHPDYGFAKALKIIKPKDSNFFKTEEERKLKVTVVKCEWSETRNSTLYMIKYFRPCDLVKIINT